LGSLRSLVVFDKAPSIEAYRESNIIQLSMCVVHGDNPQSTTAAAKTSQEKMREEELNAEAVFLLFLP
jgi:hypothetical protein